MTMKAQDLIQSITEAVESHVNVRIIFGDPIERKNITLIPVGKVQLRGGGGGGIERDADNGDGRSGGLGMGGAVDVKPVGYIKVTDDDAQFVEIVDRSTLLWGGLLIGGLALFLLIQMASRRSSRSRA